MAPDAPVVLEVEHLNAGSSVTSVKLHKGEIPGFSGLMGTGHQAAVALVQTKRTAVPSASRARATIKSPQDAIANGIGYLSEDRKR